ncbi:unnamed protein product, partial [Iphiclides podalirius]
MYVAKLSKHSQLSVVTECRNLCAVAVARDVIKGCRQMTGFRPRVSAQGGAELKGVTTSAHRLADNEGLLHQRRIID